MHNLILINSFVQVFSKYKKCNNSFMQVFQKDAQFNFDKSFVQVF